MHLPVPPMAPLPPTDREVEVSVEIAPVQHCDQPTPNAVGVAQVWDLVHGRDGVDTQQGDAFVEEVRTEQSLMFTTWN